MKNRRFLNNSYRKFILFLIDIVIIFLSTLYVSYFSTSNLTADSIDNKYLFTILIFSVINIFIYFKFGIYKTIARYSSFSVISKIYKANIFSLIAFLIIININNYYFAFKDLLFLYLILSSLICFYRIIFRYLLKLNANFLKNNFTNVVIYGAGSAGVQLLSSLRVANSIRVKAFVDDDSKLWGLEIDDIKIYSPKYLEDKSIKKNIDQIVLAMPSISNSIRSKIIDNLKTLTIPVFQVPTLNDLIKGNLNISQLNKINVIDLLGRDTVEPKFNLLEKNIKNKSVFVTGAGGSIGQELCRQILMLGPKKLIICDSSEVALYSIDKELSLLLVGSKIKLVTILGCCTNKNLIDDLLSTQKVNIIFHAAAYKHVPLIEINPISALKNNTFSTLNLCKAAEKNNVERFVLISSDKAVRPTNVMGASKRLSELIIKRFDYKNSTKNKNQSKTLYSSVRFGNVLGSSGSVVPLFEQQIRKGGPVTLTHPEITRFFMTIEEAAQLVIQSSSLAKGGDLFS